MAHLHWVWNELNGITLGILVGGFALVLSFKWRNQRWITREVGLMRDSLSRVLAGEEMLQQSFSEMQGQQRESEAKLEYVETLLNKHLGLCNGNGE